MINDNIPSVRMLIGSVRILTSGLIKVLMRARTKATMTAVIKLLISTFGKRYAVMATAKELISILTINPMQSWYQIPESPSRGDIRKRTVRKKYQ